METQGDTPVETVSNPGAYRWRLEGIMRGELGKVAWVCVGPQGLYYVGLHENEADTWQIAFGWPSAEEIANKKAEGWYVTDATLSWAGPQRDKSKWPDLVFIDPPVER